MDKDDLTALATSIGMLGLGFIAVLASAAVAGLALRVFIGVAGLD